MAARLGVDQFVVLQHEVTDTAEAVALGRRVLSTAAAMPMVFGENSVVAWASAGIVLSQPGDSVDDLRVRRDVALYTAKRNGDHGLAVYEPAMLRKRADDDALGRDLENAAVDGQLRVLFQPMTDLATGVVVGAEALVRWHHPTRGLVSPLDFIPVAERTGAIIAIGLHVLDEACRQAATWTVPAYVSVNLSALQLRDPGLAGDVLTVIERSGLSAHRLVLEVTESAVVDDRVAIPVLQELRSHGIRIAIDDFGTGYSSLQYLTRLPVDILKVDRAFVAALDGTRHGSAITEAIIRLAQILDLTTVAEGIETTAQADELRQLGAAIGQGYLYAKPLTDGDLRTYLRDAERLTA